MQAQERDPQLWRIARARAKFKSHLVVYLLVNALLWAVWYFTDHRTYGTGVPWPIWPALFWGVGLGIQGLATYGFVNEQSWSEREYQQLLRDRDAGRR
ncbi:hypothetical protein GCM10027048_25030 [Hymenobacter coalescens]